MNIEKQPSPMPDAVPDTGKTGNRSRLRVIVSVCIICLAVVAFAAALLYIFPRQTDIDLTLDAVKLDAEGNEVETVQIHLTGTYTNYLVLKDQLVLSIDPVDGLTQIHTSNKPGLPQLWTDHGGKEYLRHNMSAYDPTANAMASVTLYCTEEFDHLIFSFGLVEQDDFYYVTSVSGEYTVQEILTYFQDIIPNL